MRPSSFLSGVAQMRIGMPSARALEALEVADGHRDQIRRHLRRRRELHRVLRDRRAPACRTARLPFEIAVSPRSIVSVTANVALKAGSSKHGKRAARVGRFELRDGVVPRLGLAQVEAAQLVVEDAADTGCGSRSAPFGERLGHGERRRLRGLVERDGRPSARAAPAADRHLAELRSRPRSARLARVGSATCDADRLGALEPRAGQIDDERQVVVDGRDGRRQPLRRRG